jgi:hemerythrin-like domain-containing protein
MGETMGIFATLHREHVLIQRHIDLMKTTANLLASDTNPPRELFDKSVDFVRTYNDKFHHYKEEMLLFRYLAQKYEGRLDATLEKLRSQHDVARNHINSLDSILGGFERGEQDPTRQVNMHLNGFIRLMEVHLFSEDVVFFRLAKEMLSEEEQEALQQGFEKYEEKQGEDPTARCTQLLDECEAIISAN